MLLIMKLCYLERQLVLPASKPWKKQKRHSFMLSFREKLIYIHGRHWVTSQDAWPSDYSKTTSANLKMLIMSHSSWEKAVRGISTYMKITVSASCPYKMGVGRVKTSLHIFVVWTQNNSGQDSSCQKQSFPSSTDIFGLDLYWSTSICL